MADPVQLSSFPNLSVEDTVSLQISAHGGGSHVELVLESAPDVTWWKALEVSSHTGVLLGRAETVDADHGPNAKAIGASDLPAARLILAKAKIFGVHTGMYELRNLDAHAGQRLHFIWQRDDHRNGPVAGFFRDLGAGIVQAADAGAQVAESVANAFAEVAADLVETVGTVVRNVFDAIGDFLGQIPGVGPWIRILLHWVGTIVSAVLDLGATIVKSVLNTAAGIVGGGTRLVGGAIGGLLAWDGRLLVKALGDLASSIAGGGLVVLGKVVAVVHAVLFSQLGERALTAAERDLLRQVYRNSVALYDVRIVEGFAGLFSTNGRPFTLGNTIYMKDVDPATSPGSLVHECGHVWQFQNRGSRYATDALWAQATLPGQGYRWEAELASGKLRWRDFNLEAQAQFLEEVWKLGQLKHAAAPSTGIGVFYKDDPIGQDVAFEKGQVDHTSLALETIAYVRGSSSPRLSAFL